MLRPYITRGELPRQSREQRVHIPPPHDGGRMISVAPERLPRVASGVGIVRDHGAEVGHEQAHGIRLQNRPHALRGLRRTSLGASRMVARTSGPRGAEMALTPNASRPLAYPTRLPRQLPESQ